MMKTHMVALTLVAALASSALFAATASAVTQFLFNGGTINTELSVSWGEEITFLNAKSLIGEVRLKCSGFFNGKILAAEPWHILTSAGEILDLAGNAVTELGVGTNTSASCANEANCTEPLVWFENLPWLWELILDANGEFLLHLTEDGEEPKGQPGWDIECMGGFKLTNLCAELFTFKVSNGATDVNSTVTKAEIEAEKTQAACTSGGEGFIETTGGLIGHSEGTLQVSDV